MGPISYLNVTRFLNNLKLGWNAGAKRFWIGATNLGGKEDRFYWTTKGIIINYFDSGFTNWQSDEPNNLDKEHCVNLKTYKSNLNAWNTLKIYFICENQMDVE